MKHHDILVLDNALRKLWFGKGTFGLSAALFSSAKLRVSYHIPASAE